MLITSVGSAAMGVTLGWLCLMLVAGRSDRPAATLALVTGSLVAEAWLLAGEAAALFALVGIALALPLHIGWRRWLHRRIATGRA